MLLPVDLGGTRAVAQLGSALDWGSSGRRFKSCQPDQRISRSEAVSETSGTAFSVRSLLYTPTHTPTRGRGLPPMGKRATARATSTNSPMALGRRASPMSIQLPASKRRSLYGPTAASVRAKRKEARPMMGAGRRVVLRGNRSGPRSTTSDSPTPSGYPPAEHPHALSSSSSPARAAVRIPTWPGWWLTAPAVPLRR